MRAVQTTSPAGAGDEVEALEFAPLWRRNRVRPACGVSRAQIPPEQAQD